MRAASRESAPRKRESPRGARARRASGSRPLPQPNRTRRRFSAERTGTVASMRSRATTSVEPHSNGTRSKPEAAAAVEATLAPETCRRLLANLERVVRGKHDELRLVVAALASGGHVLIEDVPGTAKTVLARALAGSIRGASVGRIQCT